MTALIAHVPTEHGSRYLQQLCKHWGHRLAVEFDADAGSITFPSGALVTMTAQPATLDVRMDLPEGDDADHMKMIVASHLDRFAFREAPLTFDWSVA